MMIEIEKPAIKLFGKRIKVPPSPDRVPPSPPATGSAVEKEAEEEDDFETEQDFSKEQAVSNKPKDDEPPSSELTTSPVASPDSVNPKTPSIDDETSNPKNPKDPSKPALKKPDKILPCPRCNSMETKFCYYNNYNVNQPRHFCKSCQRYWTAGGTMRNVPVGAGRRKSKASSSSSSSSRYCHISIGSHHQDSNPTPNGAVLRFGPEHYRPVGSLPEKKASVKFAPYVRQVGPINQVDGTSRNSTNELPISSHDDGTVVPQVPCLSNIAWPYGVVPFYPPAAFWAYGNVSNGTVPQVWRFPPNLTILGKHPREGDVKNNNGSVLVPKTLRIDDPNEAAKSSIWATLGIENESGSKGGIFKGFKLPSGKDRAAEIETEKCRVMCANPAALSRSLNFHEST